MELLKELEHEADKEQLRELEGSAGRKGGSGVTFLVSQLPE